MTNGNHLLTIQELATELKRSTRYVRYMRQIGFRMPGNRATLEAALRFLEKRPWPCSRRWRS